MKYIKSLFLGLFVALTFSACSDWLDVNTDPNNPTIESSEYKSLLPWCQYYMNYTEGIAGSRTAPIVGHMTSTWPTAYYDGMSSFWTPCQGISTSPYQWYFVGCAGNLNSLYEKAMEAEAWHYAGAAKYMRASGFMIMTLLFSEIPYTEALGDDATPAYSTGKEIYLGVLGEIDEAIELFSKTQGDDADDLSLGDSWNGGDASKWLKMCYLLKARWINNLTKKEEGDYLDGKYDVAEIMSCLDNAMTSNSDNTVVYHTDTETASSTFLIGGNAFRSPAFSNQGRYTFHRVTKSFVDNLTNFAGNGVEDPRADKLIPWTGSQKTDGASDQFKWDGNWRRSEGIDLTTYNATIYANSYNSTTKSWYCSNASDYNLGDTAYVSILSGSPAYWSSTNLIYEYSSDDEYSSVSGTFYVRPSSPSYVATYHEACFIRAEIYMNYYKNSSLAYEWYKKGIEANIDLMNEQLASWIGETSSYANCPSFSVMTDDEINDFLNNGIGTEADITLGKIMTQKSIAMTNTLQVWNDFRRYDYSGDVFLNWEYPAAASLYSGSTNCVTPSAGKVWRRFRMSYHEALYNLENLVAIGEQVPGANTSATNWNDDEETVYAIECWWDSTQE